jgi:hypothetical protein
MLQAENGHTGGVSILSVVDIGASPKPYVRRYPPLPLPPP